jgi:hypothetical protein
MMSLSVVVFPAPFSPRNPTISPGATSNETGCSEKLDKATPRPLTFSAQRPALGPDVTRSLPAGH